MKYKHNKTGEEVEVENWVWAVVYKDRSELHQFDANTGLFHSITEVDKTKEVEMLTVYKAFGNPNMDKRIDLIVPKGCSVFHKYRNFILDAGTPSEIRVKVYMFGYGNKDYQIINYLLPNDKLVQASEDLDEIIKYI